jgi:hypothetical protein
MSDVPRNKDRSFTLYDADGEKVTLTFPADPEAGFKVVTKELPGGLPPEYTWVLSFGIQNKAGNFLLSVTYTLQGTDRRDKKSWVVYYGGKAQALNGTHTTPGDPPIGFG